jgi:hypothetical protein
MLNDNSTVSGMVTNDTEIECQSVMGGDIASDGGPGSGDNNGGDNSGDQGDGGDDQGGDDQGQDEQSCSMTALVPGATVDGAELQISASGATWSKVELG